jgi:hypothetical protein
MSKRKRQEEQPVSIYVQPNTKRRKRAMGITWAPPNALLKVCVCCCCESAATRPRRATHRCAFCSVCAPPCDVFARRPRSVQTGVHTSPLRSLPSHTSRNAQPRLTRPRFPLARPHDRLPETQTRTTPLGPLCPCPRRPARRRRLAPLSTRTRTYTLRRFVCSI